MQYVQDFDGLVIAFSQDSNIKGNGVANEGVVSTKLGLKGIPNLSEELQIARNLFLLEYTGGKTTYSNDFYGKIGTINQGSKNQRIKSEL